MKLVCSVSIGNRSIPALSVNSNRKHVKSTLALCRNPKSAKFCMILFSSQHKNGTKYEVNGNIKQILTRFINEGKATIQFKQPEHDFYIQSDVIQLKGFLHLLKRVLENKVLDKELTCSSMSVTPTSIKSIPSNKLIIQNRSEYPSKGFPRHLEVLKINDISRCSLDRGILQLMKLKILDLSHNRIEFLPYEICNLVSLSELNVSHNEFGKGSSKQWSWLGGQLSKSLKLLNLSNNNLKFLPDQLIKLHRLISLQLDNNQIKTLPSGIGSLKHLRVLTASNNLLSVLPGSSKNWKLHNLDLSNNSFDPNQQSNPAAIFPKPLPVCSMKEYAARKVLTVPLLYFPGSLPLTVIDYLDKANYCVCGNPCFDIFINQPHMLLLSTVANTFSVSSEGIVYVPVDCYFCSLKCFGSAHYNRGRQPVT